MKKLVTLIITIVILVSLSGCKSNIKLEEGQSYLILNEKSEMTMSVYLSDKEFDGSYGIDFDDDDDEIKENIIELFDDVYDMDMEVKKFKKGKDNVKFTLFSEDGDKFGYDLDYTLEDYADDNFYEDIDALSEYQAFLTYKDGEDLDEDDLEDYADSIILYVYGSDEGSYYKFPSEILLVDDNMDYEKIAKNIIYVDDNESGYVVLK